MISSILYILYIIFIVGLCIRILFDTDSPQKALIYIFLAVFFPFIGALFYLLFGINYRKNKLYKKKLRSDKEAYNKLQEKISERGDLLHADDTSLGRFRALVRLINQERNLSSSNNRTQLLINGEKKFPDVLEAIKKAKHHIHIEYYIFDNDEIGNKVGELLIEKAKEGVEVRLIYDDFGSLTLDNDFLKKLRDGGVKVVCFYEIKFYVLANRVNYRNHRKIIVIDGIIGYVGGINVSDAYINSEAKRKFWRDTHLKIEGISVFGLQNVFLDDWNFSCKEKVEYSEAYFPVSKVSQSFGNQLVQITASGPDSEYPNILYSHVLALYLSRKEVLITTPYFIPDSTFLDALKIADLRGVDVKLLVPKKSDSFITDSVSRSYYAELLNAGIEIYLYDKGFIHAKTVVCDNMVSIVGTANLDQRSFDLNFEVSAVIYDETLANELRQNFDDDLEHAKLLNINEWLERPFYIRLMERILRVISPVL